MKRVATLTMALIMVMSVIAIVYAVNLTPAVKDDPLVRMPGTQPDQGVNLEAPNRCMNCHAGYNTTVEPGSIVEISSFPISYAFSFPCPAS